MLSNKIINQCLEWLYNHQDSPVIFTSKDFEKRYKKVKSLNSSQSKEILDYLIQEDHLSLIKCGTINVYYIYINHKFENDTKQWQLISEKNSILKNDLVERRKEYEKLSLDKQEQQQSQNDASRGDLLKQYKSLTSELTLKERELKKLNQLSERWNSNFIQKSLDNIETMKENLTNLKENIDILVEYLSKTYNVNEDEIKREFDIPQEFTVFI